MLTAEQQRMVEAHLNLARKVAWQFIRAGRLAHDPAMTEDDLLAAAYVGLCEAVRRFDPGRGYAFSTFAVPTIAGYIRKYLFEHGQSGGLKVSRSLTGTGPVVHWIDAPVQEQGGPNWAEVLPAPGDVAEQATLRALLQDLPERQRRVLLLRAAGYRQPAMARMLGCSQAHVHRLEKAARLHLQAALAERA